MSQTVVLHEVLKESDAECTKVIVRGLFGNPDVALGEALCSVDNLKV